MKTIPYMKIFNPQTGKTMTLDGNDSIRNCLGVLISCCRGELLGDPDFGTDIKKYLMTYKNALLYDKIKTDIIKAVSKYEKRVNLTEGDIGVYKSLTNPNLLYIDLKYLNRLTGAKESLQLTINGEVMKDEY